MWELAFVGAGLPGSWLVWELACVGAGLPAMQTTRYIRYTQLMPSQASQLPHKPPTFLIVFQLQAFASSELSVLGRASQ